MKIRRASWAWALVLSIAAHGAVVAAFTPDPNEVAEAGSGAGSSVEGSIDATLGSDVEIQEFLSEELKTAQDTEVAPTAEPATLAALSPSPIDAEPTPQPTQPAAAEAVQPAAVPELSPAATPSSSIAPVLTADLSAPPIESDLPAAPSPVMSEIVPTETLAAIAPTTPDLAPADPAPAVSAATTETQEAATPAVEAKPVEPVAQPVQTAVLTTLKPVEELMPQEVPEELAPLPEAKPVEVQPVEKPVETKPVEAKRVAPKPVEKKIAENAEPTRKPPREKAEKADRKRKAEAPSRGNAETESRRGASVANSNTTARDGGTGRSREAGSGAAANSNYKGKVRAKIARSTQMPSKAKRLGITGRAQVAFIVTPSGAAQNIVLASSAGNPVLDEAALSAVRRASPFPPMPQGMSQLSLSVPITFDLDRR
jgi:protein TonB